MREKKGPVINRQICTEGTATSSAWFLSCPLWSDEKRKKLKQYFLILIRCCHVYRYASACVKVEARFSSPKSPKNFALKTVPPLPEHASQYKIFHLSPQQSLNSCCLFHLAFHCNSWKRCFSEWLSNQRYTQIWFQSMEATSWPLQCLHTVFLQLMTILIWICSFHMQHHLKMS